MRNRITVCLTNWRRPELLRRLVGALAAQSLKPCLFLWDNGGGFQDDRIDWAVESSRNVLCWPRWLMASCATTEFCCIIDDDVELLTTDVLETAVERLLIYPEHTIVGVEGVTLVDGKPYQLGIHVRAGASEAMPDVVCDIVKGKFMLMRTCALHKGVPLGAVDQRREDDIAVSGLLADGQRGQHRCLPSLWPKIRLINAPHALWRQPGHFERRDVAASYYFPTAR